MFKHLISLRFSNFARTKNYFLLFRRLFQDHAIDLLKKCTKISAEKPTLLVDTDLPQWNERKVMDLAALSEFKEFIAQARCQVVTNMEWRGHISGSCLWLKVNIYNKYIIYT